MMVDVRTYDTLGQAASALSSIRGAFFFGGGTLLMRAINEADPAVATIIRTTDPAFRQIRSQGDRVVIGAGVTMSQILASRDLDFLHPVARVIGGPAVRSLATVGGNLFAPPPYGDLTAALLAAGATIEIAGGYSTREARSRTCSAIATASPAPLVASITVQRPRDPAGLRFLKVSRVKPKGIAVLSIAAAANGRSTRIAYNGMSPTPMRALAVERALEGRTLDASGIAPALAVAADGTSPADDAIASAWYRKEVLPVHLRRLLLGESA
ncbi:MAG: xanthine dehydrogenase family protein subunit M [Rhizobiales bacterium]|nr:xanthine dehydrogenase family protein subunit M [Hyphomicrobiales bacterium]